MDILILRRRNNGWIAYMESNQGVWEYGNTQAEAIGNLILTIRRQPIGFMVEFK